MDAPGIGISSELKQALSLAGRAALTFWVTFVLASAVAIGVVPALHQGSPEWGGASGAVVIGIIASVILGGVAGLCHGAAVFGLHRIYAGMDPPHRKAASVSTVLVVLLGVFFVLPVIGIEGDLGQKPFLPSWVALPFGLSIPVIAAVSLLPGARAADGAAGTSQAIHRRVASFLLIGTILVAGALVFPRHRGPRCDDFLVSRLPSPDGVHDAVIYQSDCGAPSEVRTHALVLTAPAYVPSRWGSGAPLVPAPDTLSPILIIDSNHGAAPASAWGGPAIDATWVARDSLLLRFDPRARVVQEQSTAGRVVIRYASVVRGGP